MVWRRKGAGNPMHAAMPNAWGVTLPKNLSFAPPQGENQAVFCLQEEEKDDQLGRAVGARAPGRGLGRAGQ